MSVTAGGGAGRSGAGEGAGPDAATNAPSSASSGAAPARPLGAGTVVCVPTYNERESLPVTLDALLAAVPDVHVLVIDDGSPDGTGAWAQGRADADPRVHVLHRSGKQGLGAAYRAGFAWALGRGYDVVCEMDADGSHRPSQLPRLLGAVAGGADLAIGSRWVPGGRVENWPLSRRAISQAGNLYTRLALGIGVRDATAGYRAFRRGTLEAVDVQDVASSGYCFQIDMTWRALQAGREVVEVPISFVERVAGASKMSRAIVAEALWRVTVWGVRHRLEQLRRLSRRQGDDAGALASTPATRAVPAAPVADATAEGPEPAPAAGPAVRRTA